jgi:hypothetical protein
VAGGAAGGDPATGGFDVALAAASTATGLVSGLPAAILGATGFAGVGALAVGLATTFSAAGLAGFAGVAIFLAAAACAALAGAARCETAAARLRTAVPADTFLVDTS